MKKLLILFANSFPYNISEPFLKNEISVYHEFYDKTLIVTNSKKNEKPTREINDPTIELISDHTLSKDKRSIIEAIPFMLTDKMFYKELKNLIFSKGFSLKKLYDMVVVSLCGNHRAWQAYRWLKKHPEYEVNVIYSTWLYISAYGAVRLNKKLKNKHYTISRAHGFDVYSERHKSGYIPFHQQLYNEIDEVSTISSDGKKYLENKYGLKTKVNVRRLGALDRGCHNPCADRDVFRIVSCSRVIPLKRLHRIADALSKISDKKIHWVHLGGGEELEALKDYAKKTINENISVDFKGAVPNTEVYDIYGKEPFHAFVNISESEGIPVSVMEAMSFDIPVIATSVGGVPELVDEGKNGFLLDADYTDDELVKCIYKMADMPEEEYASFRKSAREKFEKEYNALPNYREFLGYLYNKRK